MKECDSIIKSIEIGNITHLQELDYFKIAAYIYKCVGVTSAIEHPFGDKVAIWDRQDFEMPVEYFIGSKFTDGMNAEQKDAFYFSDEWQRFSKSVALHLELIIGDFINKCSEE